MAAGWGGARSPALVVRRPVGAGVRRVRVGCHAQAIAPSAAGAGTARRVHQHQHEAIPTFHFLSSVVSVVSDPVPWPCLATETCPAR